MNRYVYVGGSPLDYVDPSGMVSTSCLRSLAGVMWEIGMGSLALGTLLAFLLIPDPTISKGAAVVAALTLVFTINSLATSIPDMKRQCG